MKTSFSQPVLWEQPQWMVSCDKIDFGRVRPGQYVQRPIIVANVGGGAASLSVRLRCTTPWLQLRVGEGADWTSEVTVSLQSGEENLILCRVDPSKITREWGGQDAIIEISGDVANIANAAHLNLNAENRLQLPPIKVEAYFLEPRFLQLSQREVSDPSSTTSVSATATGRCEIEINSKAVPLGISPKVVLRLQRSDALPTRSTLDLFTVKRGKEQWFDCQLISRGDEQSLELTFYTSNRETGKTHSVEIEVKDSDDLVEPAKIVWNMTVSKPPLLDFEPQTVRAVPTALTKQEVVLNNVGEGELHVEAITVPGECRPWLSLDTTATTPFSIAAGENRAFNIYASGLYLSPNEQHRGNVQISCNHAGRRVVRRVPVTAIAPAHATRVEIDELDLQAVLTHGSASSFTLKVWNEAAKEVRLRFVAWDPSNPKDPDSWIRCEPSRVNLTPGGFTEVSVYLSTANLPVPSKQNGVELNGVLAALHVEPQGESQIWNRKLHLRVQPRPKKFGFF